MSFSVSNVWLFAGLLARIWFLLRRQVYYEPNILRVCLLCAQCGVAFHLTF